MAAIDLSTSRHGRIAAMRAPYRNLIAHRHDGIGMIMTAAMNGVELIIERA
ncbi:hypothetical protein [Bosea psychrotolerans]|uniref:hypothetical protein n=1 Tax=Bosea psychrotolerans TaxID=1871628 RepID=UPI0015E18A5A|nr:hypothetical protein [Bosea psychrotolerans]